MNSILKKKTKKLFYFKLDLQKKFKLNFIKKNLLFFFYRKKKDINFENNLENPNRKFLLQNLKKSKNKFEKFLSTTIKNNLPKIFLEDFDKLNQYYKKVNWPKNLDYVLTSYGQYYDELFKLYCAKNIKLFKLLIFQHGYGGMFVNDDMYNIYLDKKISDIYLAWGDYNKKTQKFFFTKEYQKIYSKFNFDKKKKYLFISYCFNSNLISPVNGSQNGNITNQKIYNRISNILKGVPKEFKSKIHIRNQNVNKYDSIRSSLKKYNFLKYSNIKNNFYDELEKYNLTIHFFIGTPFFECMAINKPSIIVLDEQMHLPFDIKFRKYIKYFKKYNLIFNDEKKALEFLKKDQKYLENWWNNKKMILLKESFNKTYNYVPKNYDKELKRLIE